MGFPQWVFTHTKVVCNILFARSPVQVTYDVVAFIAVAVADFVLRWAWAYERCGHKTVDIDATFMPSFAEPHCVVARRTYIGSYNRFGGGSLPVTKQHSPWQASHPTTVRDLVKSFVIWYRFPSFHTGS